MGEVDDYYCFGFSLSSPLSGVCLIDSYVSDEDKLRIYVHPQTNTSTHPDV